MNNHPLGHPLTVIVPVYNAAVELRALIASLEKSVPAPEEGLSFVFADDASVDPGLPAVWKHPFFARPDVRLRRSERNVGFVGNVNCCIGDASQRDDILLLNSDTRVFRRVFATLQEEAYSVPRIASVTPLTNNGTIASLFGFPYGGDLPPGLSAESIADAVARLDFASPRVWAPTGVGFCMYLKREALAELGSFDPCYGRGFGEETDWCQKASANGWRNLISTRAFVYHSGTKSFTVLEKDDAIQRAQKLVSSRYPRYLDEAKAYCARDPLRFHRLRILLEVLRDRSRGEMMLFVLHGDPRALKAGGTGVHVLQLLQLAAQRGISTVEIFPGEDEFRLRGYQAGHCYFNESVEQSSGDALFALLSETIDVVHAHHFRGWSESALESLLASPFRKKILTLHDYSPLCPSAFLLSGPQATRFCEVEADLTACNRCLAEDIGFRADTIQGYRARWQRRLNAFDRLVVPSPAMLRYWGKGLLPEHPALFERIETLAHDISQIVALSARSVPCTRKEPRPLVAFVGDLGIHKGSELVIEAAARLREAGFEVEVFGRIHRQPAAIAANIRVTHYRTLADLLVLLRQRAPMIVAHPSLTAESFCFAFYEALMFSETAIPVVGSFGNPASVIRETGAGVVMAEMSSEGLVTACEQARAAYPDLAAKCAQYRDHLRGRTKGYADHYLRLVDKMPARMVPAKPGGLDLAELEASTFGTNGRRPTEPRVRTQSFLNRPKVSEMERLSTDIFNTSSIEHLHRYVLAAEFCIGKNVLDVASGEGYGSHLLSKTAGRVAGVDISDEAIASARAKYVRPNLDFLVGRADAIPLGDASVDVVVSFETLEHHARHEEMFAEIKRVLRPGGLLIISTPDKLFFSDVPEYRNEYHVRELYREEFKTLIERYFVRHRLLVQAVSYGTLISPEHDWGGFSYYRGDFVMQEKMPHMPRPLYNIAIASDGFLPETAVTFFDGHQVLREYQEQMADGNEHLARIAQLESRIRGQERVIRDLERSLSYRFGRALTWPLRRFSSR